MLLFYDIRKKIGLTDKDIVNLSSTEVLTDHCKTFYRETLKSPNGILIVR